MAGGNGARIAYSIFAACSPLRCMMWRAKPCSWRAIRMGKKPLHYSLLADGAFVFGSELKSAAALSGHGARN